MDIELPSLILLNGPPRAGKDYAGRILFRILDELRPTAVVKFATEVKERCHAAYRIFDVDGEPVPADSFERTKDQPSASFLGRTPRECYIAFSEKLMKPLHGQDVFGRLLLKTIQGFSGPWTFVITDSGFAAEARPLVEHVGASRALLIRLHREGRTFAGDSRSYIELDGVRTVDIVNPGDLEGFERVLRRALGAAAEVAP